MVVTRYGREDLDVLGLTFRKDLFLVWYFSYHDYSNNIMFNSQVKVTAWTSLNSNLRKGVC